MLAPFRDQAFYDAYQSSFAQAFHNGTMLLREEKTLVGLGAIGDGRLVLVIGSVSGGDIMGNWIAPVGALSQRGTAPPLIVRHDVPELAQHSLAARD